MYPIRDEQPILDAWIANPCTASVMENIWAYIAETLSAQIPFCGKLSSFNIGYEWPRRATYQLFGNNNKAHSQQGANIDRGLVAQAAWLSCVQILECV